MKEIHAYRNEDGTYRVEGIACVMDNEGIKDVVFKAPRAKLTVTPFTQAEDEVILFSCEVKED
jgi:hypothetical protein